jgi:integrase
MFNFAVGRDIIDASPCVQIPAPSKENRRERNLSEDEISVFWDKLRDAKMSEEIRLALKFLLVTAQRKSEVTDSEWKEFDLENKWWTIPPERTKNKQSHRVPLTPIAIQILKELKLITGEYQFTFASPEGATKRNPDRLPGTVPIIASAVDNALRDNLTEDPKTKRTNIFNLGHFTPHDLRRTAASMMTRSGIQRLTVKKILNHSDREITAVYDRYEYDKEKQTAMRAWDKELKKILTNQSKAESKQILTKQEKKTPKKIVTNQKKENANEEITYEQFLKNNKLRDFTKK